MSKKDVWVSPRGEKWVAQTEGSNRAAGLHDTQRAAFEQARSIAQNRQSEVIIQGRDGQIREKNSYGNDPRRSKG